MKLIWKTLKYDFGVEVIIKGSRQFIDEWDIYSDLKDIVRKYDGVTIKRNVNKTLLESIAIIYPEDYDGAYNLLGDIYKLMKKCNEQRTWNEWFNDLFV